jgi:hypothetical protein
MVGKSNENLNDPIRNRSRDLTTGSAVPHPTLPRHALSYMSAAFEILVRSAFHIKTLLNCCSIHPHTHTHTHTYTNINKGYLIRYESLFL